MRSARTGPAPSGSAEIDDAALDVVWSQLRLAHQAGLAHRALTADAVLVDGIPARRGVLLTGWESGDVASSELARRVDIAQMLALLALRVGAARAVASAGRVLSGEELATIGPLLQTIVMPRATREEFRARRGLMGEVREALLEHVPEADIEPERVTRFGVRTVLTLALTIGAGVLVVTTINLDQIRLALTESQPWWAAATFGLGMVTFLGGGDRAGGVRAGPAAAVAGHAGAGRGVVRRPGGAGRGRPGGAQHADAHPSRGVQRPGGRLGGPRAGQPVPHHRRAC